MAVFAPSFREREAVGPVSSVGPLHGTVWQKASTRREGGARWAGDAAALFSGTRKPRAGAGWARGGSTVIFGLLAAPWQETLLLLYHILGRGAELTV